MIYNGITNAPWSRSVVTEPFVTLDGVFSDAELLRIVAHCESEGLGRAKIFGDETNDSVRRCDIKFFHVDADTAWFFGKMNHAINSINSCYYGFDLNGYDAFQYTSYNAAELGTYHWHMDCFLGGKEYGLPNDMIQPRKLSLTLALNEDYEGGEFQVNMGDQQSPVIVPSRKGRIIAFPSYVIHTVRPVTKGFRRSIVIWVTGPKWR
jgi:PKHD-type hydroxylase